MERISEKLIEVVTQSGQTISETGVQSLRNVTLLFCGYKFSLYVTQMLP